MPSKLYTLEVALYEHKVIVLLTKDPEEVEEAFRKFKLDKIFYLNAKEKDKIRSGLGGYAFVGQRSTSIIWMGKRPQSAYDVGTYAHECVHVAVALLNAIGLPIKADCDEALTYIVDYLVREGLKAMKVRVG